MKTGNDAIICGALPKLQTLFHMLFMFVPHLILQNDSAIWTMPKPKVPS